MIRESRGYKNWKWVSENLERSKDYGEAITLVNLRCQQFMAEGLVPGLSLRISGF
jgi:hypothetical protein